MPVQTAPVASNTSISLDDDDDDDDLEQIVQKANKQANANGSRENSSSSLQIKSQVQAQHKAQQVDAIAVRQVYQETGGLPAGSRLALWQRAVQPESQDSASMYAVQTTSRTLPSQALLRKEVEALCSRIFASAAHARVLREVGDSMRGTHLLFIDSAETLLTHLCHQFDIDYVSGMALTFAPLLIASGSEPLHPEIVETLAATCRRFLPHIAQKLPVRSSAAGRRPRLKRLLLYHAPQLASHLQENFPTWNNAPPEEYDASSGVEGSGAIPDSWLASFFESDAMASDSANFDFLLKVWDCSLLLEAFSSNENAPLSTGSFITVYALIAAEKALLRMQGEQLRHCMATTLAETLLRGEATKDAVFVRNIRQLMNATPPCFYAKLRSAGLAPPSVVDNAVSSPAAVIPVTTAASNTGFGMNSLLTASTQGVKDLSNLMIDMPVKLMIDMPVKLLTMVPLNPMAALSSPTSSSLTDSPETQQLFYLHVQAMEVAAVSVTLDANEVIPSVFGGIQGHDTPEAGSIRYFIVDCRGPEDKCGGQVPTAFHFDPDAVADPIILDQVLATLNPLKSAGVHICVMGQGFAGALKTGGKTILSPTMDGTKWLMKKSAATTADSFSGAVIHDVVKGHVNELTKGMTVSRAQMLPCVSSPFFACYKKKVPIMGAPSHSNVHARRLVVMENHIVVLKSTTRNEDDVYMVKSCHPLAHVARMTCLKKNALMVSIYYKWKAIDGQIVERRNSYEVQQRDDFIKAVKTTMDKM
ncbi:hypothetical protein BBO99_00000847 [Phytophthora kernoviae]|uniref:Rab-GAP TBC domain-containing protein n=2 Tax=Phytophthora kernoviae TaxID=325452 RepID=A0A3R7J9R8_9STRA|nr:hypothetical protein G195_001560 [Phytophthora kernoviae 00238/432]KAG2531853.1 hypothetical protein JM16_000672 [Phytophthora kernoviae]KAG2532741.1 hypothetical protein JM18_000754 [Phytophthora kernoviae]RLN44380.1 hypothetical protein BBI17_000973 [Phytophthora kernoviae]RLN85005.1 hypothetical protein BBO99_00000847 [Phytophthora kernoviae]